MRYLYADSEPFPPQYNFLAALEAFVPHAARAVLLDAEVRSLRRAHATAEAARERSLDVLAAFHQASMATVAQTLPPNAAPPTLDYVRQVSELAARLVDEAKRSGAAASESARAQTQMEVDRRRGEIRTALAELLVPLRLPTVSTTTSMRLMDGRNELSAVFTSEGGVVTSFDLSTRDLPAWQVPRKVSDFAQGIDLRVGLRRSWFGKGVQHEMAHIDDYVISGFELADDAAEIRLRKKPGDKDALVFDVRRTKDGLAAEVHYPTDAEAEGIPTTLEAEALMHLERLWEALQLAAAEAHGHRDRLLAARLGNEDVVEQDRVAAFAQSIIRQIAPTVVEIAKRTPNAAELSLKSEGERGRREEIYVRKADLLAHLAALGPAERTIFAPLALEASVVATVSSEKLPNLRSSEPDDGAWDVDMR